MIFFMAAGNVLETCDNYDSFKLWLRLYGLVPFACAVLMQVFVVLISCVGNEACFKMSMRIQALTGCVSVGFVIWGFVEYTKTDEAECVDPQGDINPRLLAIVFLVCGAIGAPGTICAALRRGEDPNMVEVPMNQ